MHQKFNSDHFTFLKFENLPSSLKVKQLFWQQLCYQVAADAAALLPGSSTVNRKFNSDHVTFLKFENLSSSSKVRQQFWQQLYYQLTAVTAAWLLVSSSIHWKFDSDHLTFLMFENPSSGSRVRLQLGYQVSAVYQVAAQFIGNLIGHFTFLKFENSSSSSTVRWQFWQQLCYQFAAIAAALVAAWLLGSSSMQRKFNSDHFTFLKFENTSSGSKVNGSFGSSFAIKQQLQQLLWQQLGCQVADQCTGTLILIILLF